MIRTIIKIDEDRCDGCGMCVIACHESAIAIIDGKARLIRDDFCDGLGNCLPACPTGAISFEEREAAAFDEAAVLANIQGRQHEHEACGCPSADAKSIEHKHVDEHEACGCPGADAKSIECGDSRGSRGTGDGGSSRGGRGTGDGGDSGDSRGEASTQQQAVVETHLNQWPTQMKLVPPNAPFFYNADLLIAADCAAYVYGDFHHDYMKDRITLIGCPKLDDVDYSEKLTAILKMNTIKSITVVRIEVPCCGGIEGAVRTALRNCGKSIPLQAVTISVEGKVL